MATLTARLLTLGQTSTDTTSYSIQAPSIARLGMCPVNSTSVSDIQAIWQRFPKVNSIRLFSSTSFISWSSPLWGAIPTSVRKIAYSTKTRQPDQEIRDYWSAMPSRFRQQFNGEPLLDWIIDHEPEQQTSGDPTPAEYRLEYQQIGQLRLAHPDRQFWGFGPCHTEYRAYRDGEAWWNDYGVVGTYPGVTRLGWDIYDTGYEQEFPNGYRTPSHMFDGLFNYRARVNSAVTDGVVRTANVDEWGIARDADADPAWNEGDQAAAAMQAHWANWRQRPGSGSLNWFDRGGCYLGASPTDPAGRPLEYQAFSQMAAAL